MRKTCIKKLNGFEVVDEETGASLGRASMLCEAVELELELNKRDEYYALRDKLYKEFPDVTKHIIHNNSESMDYLNEFKRFQELYNDLF